MSVYTELLLAAGILNLELLNLEDFIELAIRLTINLTFIVLIVRYVYYPAAKRKDFLFTYILISISVFLLCFLLENVKLDLAFALGLFAIFGIIRYRTDPIPIKEMTYLFIIIALSVMNALVNKKVSLTEMIFANLVVVVATYGLERIWLLRHEYRKTVTYERIDLIVPEKREELIADLEKRTGVNINRIEIGQIDFLRDTTLIRIFFYQDEQNHDHMDDTTGFKI